MGLGALNLGNFSLDPSNLKVDKRLLGKIKTLMPGEFSGTFFSVFGQVGDEGV
jgi:hypothetical protein